MLKRRRGQGLQGGGGGGEDGIGRGGRSWARRGCAICVRHLSQALDFESFRYLQKGREALLIDGYLSSVHELQECLHLVVANISQEHDGMTIGRVVEHGLEVGRARREHHLVRLQLQSLARQGDVHEGLSVKQILEDGEKIVLMVIPSQAVLLRRQTRCGCSRGRGRRR